MDVIAVLYRGSPVEQREAAFVANQRSLTAEKLNIIGPEMGFGTDIVSNFCNNVGPLPRANTADAILLQIAIV